MVPVEACLFVGDQCSWVAKNILVRGEVFSFEKVLFCLSILNKCLHVYTFIGKFVGKGYFTKAMNTDDSPVYSTLAKHAPTDYGNCCICQRL